MKKRILPLLLSLLLLLTACGSNAAPAGDAADVSAPADPETTTDSGSSESAADEALPGLLTTFSTTDLEGNAVDQSILEGYELTMVNVWATYCSPCIREMPGLGELAEEYAPQGVQIIGFVTDVLNSDASVSQSQVELARDIARQTGANYTHIVPTDPALLSILSQITVVPTTFFVDENGHQVGYAYSRSRDKAGWVEVIESVRAEAKQ